LTCKRGRAGAAKYSMMFLGLLAAATAVTAVMGMEDNVSAVGDQVQHTHGEDPGYYDEHNNNPFEDIPFPGLSMQNGTGV
jgi:hypothetical protein